MLRRLLSRIAALFRRRTLDDEFGEELSGHLALLMEENLRRGMNAQEARRRALLELGGAEQTREIHRDARSVPWLEHLFQDFRYAARTFRREPGFSLTSTLILALGIGANVAIFSVVQALMLRPLPFAQAGRLVWIENHDPEGIWEGLSSTTSRMDTFEEWQRSSESMDKLAAYNAFFGRESFTLSGKDEPERLIGVHVTQNLFSLLGVKAQLGRGFLPEESLANNRKVAIISHGLWQRRYGSRSSILGRAVLLNDEPVVIAGVMPASFDFGSIFSPGVKVDVFAPLITKSVRENWGNTLAVVGRLKPGTTIEAAREEFQAIIQRMHEAKPGFVRYGAKLSSLEDAIRGKLRRPLAVLWGAVAVVLLIVCLNLSNLWLSRIAARRKEVAVRNALGAGTWRVTQLYILESLLFAVLGSGLGIGLAYAATGYLTRLRGIQLPLLATISVDGSVALFTLGITLFLGVALGLAPALQTLAVPLTESLKETSRGASEGRGQSWTRSALVVAELGLACVLLTGTGLLLRSFVRVLEVDLGFRSERTMALRVDPGERHSTRAQRNAYYREIVESVRVLPGVEAVSLTDALPLDRDRSWGVAVKGRSYREEDYPTAHVRVIGGGYFGAMRIPVVAGREFGERDTPESENVIIINQTAAKTLLPGDEPVGRMLQVAGRDWRIVGIVHDVRHAGLEKEAGLEMYLPLTQESSPSVDLVVRTASEPEHAASIIRAALRKVDPGLPATQFRPLQQVVDESVSPRRFLLTLVAVFAGLAVVLAALGVYSVISYSVSRRTREIGIRMALGASSRKVQFGVLAGTVRLALAGIALGIAGAYGLIRVLESLLFGVKAQDPATYGVMSLLLVTVALAAGYLPARRASRVDPMTALRTD